ncbi:MAG TPA: TauD/TfdA family dioxygenase [Stellaceae bacterium]|nr:TauD/TfdA family dioxygenase [Stellaceae bacterium]
MTSGDVRGFEIRPMGSALGAEVLAIDLARPLDDAAFRRISDAFDHYSVLVFRDQKLSPEQHIAFSRRFGPLQVNVRSEFNRPGYPEIYIVSNVMVDGRPIGSRDAGRYWHSDICYVENPSRASLLYALEIPIKDGVARGDTLFASTCAAYEALPEELKRRLEGLRAANSYNAMYERKVEEFGLRPPLTPEARAKYPADAIHPVVRTHPRTGRKSVYVCEGYTTHVVGVSEEESRALLRALFAEVVRPAFIYRHRWRVGDLVMWDNCATQHKVSFDYELPLRRRLERTTVEGSVPY